MMHANTLRMGMVLGVGLLGCGDELGPPSAANEPTASVSSPLVNYGAWQVTGAIGSATTTSTMINSYIPGSYTTLISMDSNYWSSAGGSAGPKYSFTNTTMSVCPGMSQIGLYMYSPDAIPAYDGVTFAGLGYFPFPDAAWPVFLGTTSLGQMPNSPWMYLATLAVPAANMPKDGSCITTGNPLGLGGGVCILRSNNGGPPGTMPSFTQADADCLHNATYDPYDAVEVTGTAAGNIYVAVHNPKTQQIEFWWASGPGGPFMPQPAPFPGQYITEAPRMVDNGNGGVHLIAGGRVSPTAVFTGEIYWAEFSPPAPVGNQGTWGGAAPVTNQLYWGNKATIQAAPGTAGKIRLRSQYDLARAGNGSVYVSYVSVIWNLFTPTTTYLNTSQCFPPGQSGGCIGLPNMTYFPPTGQNVFNPALGSAFVTQLTTAPNVEAKVTWLESTPSNGVIVNSASLGDGTNDGSGLLRVREEAGWNGIQDFQQGPNLPCPTKLGPKLTTVGDWDVYDEHLGVFQATPSSDPMFVRAFTDSSYGTCANQGNFWATPMAVSGTTILWP